MTISQKQLLETAVYKTVAYSDVFDYPLTPQQLHRYLEGVTTSPTELATLLQDKPTRLSQQAGYITLAGREQIIQKRQKREKIAQVLWPLATHYGQLIAHIPFVRMVAVTGSLTMNNSDADADIDYLVVTENGRLWLARLFMIALVKWASWRGVHLCPNYILSKNALVFDSHTLYVAREIAQMVPLSGFDIYHQMRQQNPWTEQFLPNAKDAPTPLTAEKRSLLQTILETPLRNSLGTRLNQWEMNRKIEKLKEQETSNSETAFSADYCKGHFNAYHQPTLTAYQKRINQL